MDSRCLLLLGLLPLSLSLVPAALAADDTPDLDLLEFLGEWEDADGEWLDPLQILAELEADTKKSTATPAKEQKDD